MISISKNVYIGKLDDMVHKYNNTYHRTIKMRHVDVTSSIYFDSIQKIIRKVLNLKLMIMLEYQNIKRFLQKAMFQIGLKKVLMIKKVKNTVLWKYVISDLNGEEILGTCYEEELQKTNQNEFRRSNEKKRR